MQQEFSDQGFTVIAIAIDDQGEETVESFVKNRQFSVDGAARAGQLSGANGQR